MEDPPAPVRKPCCVCAAPEGKHCTKCKSRHYCSKACQLVDWKRGHNKACKQLTAEFQDRLLDELMPAKLKIKEEPAIVEDVLLADGSKAAARLPAVGTTAVVKAIALNDDAPDWRGTCAICIDQLPVYGNHWQQILYECCCKRMCKECSEKCQEYDERCPLCRSPARMSDAEWVRRMQKHVDKGHAEAHIVLGNAYSEGTCGLKKSPKQAFELYKRPAAQGHARAQNLLGKCFNDGEGVKIDHKAAALWYRRAAEQGLPEAQSNFGAMLYDAEGVAQSYDEAVRWFRLAAAQGGANALFMFGACHANGQGVPRDLHEALRFKRAAAAGHAHAPAEVQRLGAFLAAARAT